MMTRTQVDDILAHYFRYNPHNIYYRTSVTFGELTILLNLNFRGKLYNVSIRLDTVAVKAHLELKLDMAVRQFDERIREDLDRE